MIKISFACGMNGEFGFEGGFPWKKMFKPDMDAFKKFTEGCTLVMGRKTFESLPSKLRNLKHVVFSSQDTVKCKNGETPDLIVTVSDYDKYINNLHNVVGDVCIIGGASLIESTIHLADTVLMTMVKRNDGTNMICDVSVEYQSPSFHASWGNVKTEYQHYAEYNIRVCVFEDKL